MSSSESVPDGSKYVSPQGTRAVKGGIRPRLCENSLIR
jgi:lipoic acid synthetase